MVADNEISFRLRGVPNDWTQDELSEHLKPKFDNTAPAIRSLTPDPTRNWKGSARQMATVNFERLPDLLKKRGRQHLIAMGDEGGGAQIEVDDEFEGFTLLHSEPEGSCDADVIAISGLNGHAFGSFKSKGSDAMWLRDFLPKSFPRSRIFIYGYDTKRDSFQSPTDIAKTFKHALGQLRKNSARRPWIVIGHSLGGLIAKIAIKHMAISEIREEYDTYQSLRAVIFFGVPSDGMKTESLRPLFKEQAQRNMLDNIDELNPAYLREVSSGYMHALSKLVDCTSFYFYEMLLSPTLVRREIAAIGEHKLRWDRNGPPEILVSSHSATQGKLNENDPKHRVFPVQKTHSDLVKFSSENDTTYKTVVDCLESIITEMGKIDQRDRSLASGENQITEIERACVQSLAFASMDWIKRDAQVAVHENAFSWFFKHATVEEWMATRQRILWILGYAECGKTALMQFATKCIRDKARENVVAEFFVNGRCESISNKPVRIYRSFLFQLLPHFPRYSKSLAAVFQRNQDSRGQYGKRWKWTEVFLREFTLDMLENACSGDGNRRVFLFVDGINELEPKPAENFIQTFNRFLGKPRKAPLNLEVCISCRYSPRLRDGGLAISMDSENAQDIRYVVEHHPVMSRLRRRGEELHNLILERARGSFGWAYGTLELVTKLYERGERYKTIIAEVKQEQRKIESKRAKNLAMTEAGSYSEEDCDDFSDNNLTAYESSDSEDEGQRRGTPRKKIPAFKSGAVPATRILPTRTKIPEFR